MHLGVGNDHPRDLISLRREPLLCLDTCSLPCRLLGTSLSCEKLLKLSNRSVCRSCVVIYVHME